MTERLTDEELARADELDAGATPGPWEANLDSTGSTRCIWPTTHGEEIVVGAWVAADGFDSQQFECGSDANLEFIAFARTALPALVAEVREHRAREAAGAWEYALIASGDDEPWSDYYESRELLSANLDALAAREDEHLVRRRAPGPWEEVHRG